MEDSQLSASELASSEGKHISRDQRYYQDIQTSNEQLEKAQQKIEELEQTISNQQQTIKAAGSFLEHSRQGELENYIRAKTLETDALRGKIEARNSEFFAISQSKRSESTLLLELEHLKADNERLVTLLKRTEEFKKAASLSGHSPSSSPAITASKEMEDWVPAEAWRVAHDFLAKHGSSGFHQTHVDRLMDALNAAWRQREKRVLTQVKEKCAQEMQKLRRKVVNAPEYDQVQSSSQVNHLKSDLEKARADLKLFSKGRPSEIDKVFKQVIDLQDKNKALALENAKLNLSWASN